MAYLSKAKNSGKVSVDQLRKMCANPGAARHGDIRELPDHTGKPGKFLNASPPRQEMSSLLARY